MRSPSSGGTSSSQRSGSPHSPKSRNAGQKGASVDQMDNTEKNPARDLDDHVKQVTELGETNCEIV